MDDLLSEKEQIDQIRSWWKEYGAYVIGGVALGALIIFAFKYYQDTKLQAQVEASAIYETLVEHVAGGDLDQAELAANEIRTAYADTSYAGSAGLAMARLYMDKNRDQDAALALLGVINGSADDSLKHVARMRLGRIYLYQDKAQEAVDLLAAEDNSAFAASYGEILGDAYTLLGRVADAQAAYQKVLLDPLAQGTVDQKLVQWKALDLPELEIDSLDAGEPPESQLETEPETEPDPEAEVEAEESVTEEIE